MPEPAISLELYAAILNEFAAGGSDLSTVLGRHGLGEAEWEAAEAYWDAKLDEEIGDGSEPGVPLAMGQLAEALTRARPAPQEPPLSLDSFIELLARQQRGHNLMELLERKGIPLATFLEAQRYWLSRLASDAALRSRFVDGLR